MTKTSNTCLKTLSLILIVCLVVPTMTFAQSLHQTFHKSHIKTIDVTLEEFTQKSQTLNRQLNLGEYGTYNVILEQTQMFHINYKGSNTPLTFKGYVENTPNSTVTLTVNNNFLSGSIQTSDREIFFEPYRYFDAQAAHNEVIIYDTHDIVSKEVTCFHNQIEQEKTQYKPSQNSKLKSAAVGCYEAEIFLVADYSMYDEYGSEQAVIDRMTAVLTQVQTLYDNEFNDPITFIIADTYVATCPDVTCDPWSDTKDVNTLLGEFATWGNDQTTILPFDVASFWTRRDLAYQGSSTVVGFANTGSVCGGFPYNINEDSDAIANNRNTQTHELGHNFGASHDATAGYIMSEIGGGLTWSQTSLNVINAYYAGENGECLCKSGYGCADEFAHNYDPDAQQTVDGACQTCTDGIQNGPETDIDIGPTCLPDIVATSCEITGDLCRKILVQNHGAVVNSVYGRVGLYLSDDPNITTDDYLVDSGLFGYVSLSPNSFGIVNVCGDITNIPDGTYYVGAIVDYQGVITELDETNNIACTGETYIIGGIPGCTDSNACNYDANATVDDGSCIDCNTAGETTTQSCNDGNPCTVNDQETILTCDGTVCVPCAGTFADADGDTICDANDICPGFDDTKIGNVCDDSDACTANDVYTSNCECVGTFQDADNDTVCDANDVCPGFDDTKIGTACDDNDACTTNDVYTSNCECKGTFQDADNDTVCDANDVCPGFDDTKIGTACDDGDVCTTGDVYNSNCECVGTFQDADNDTVCDANDVCPGFDDTTIGDACDDNNDCTTNDVYTSNCECKGTPTDADGDGVCDADDICPGFDDTKIGTACDDGDICTTGDVYTTNCECTGTYSDTDNDGVCDAQDVCPSLDDTLIGTVCDDLNDCTINDVYTSNCECKGTSTDANGEPICQPDLVASGPCGYFGAGSLAPCVSTKIYNTGQDAGNVPFFMGIYLSEDQDITTDDYLVGTREYAPLAVGESVDITICGQPSLRATVPPGTYYYRAIIDYDNAQQESNENNNLICGNIFTYTIDPPGGCTDPNACNYDPDATQDNGTCIDCDTAGQSSTQACDDGDPCTTNDQQTILTCDGTVCVPCAGTFADADGDGVCDANDICPIGDDNIDTDQNGVPDACEGDTCPTINFQDNPPVSYGGGQDNGSVNVSNPGDIIWLENNAWKAIPLSYTVTANTVVSFDFRSTIQGEIHGVGFDTNTSISSNYTFRVHGTQSWGNGTYDNYDGSGNYTSYTIPVGNFYTGQFQYFFFVTDHDGGARNGNSYFKNVRIYEDLNGDLLCDAPACTAGTPCNDGDACTTNDVYNADCECAGTYADADNDGVCDADDVCPNFDDTKIGTACDDGNVCTTNEVYTSNCECVGTDSDGCQPDLKLYLGDNISCKTATDIFGVALHAFNIINDGLAPSSASEIGLYLSTDANYDNQDVLLTTLAIPPLAIGEQFAVNMSADLVAAAPGPGTYYSLTVIDHLDSVSEGDENNNFACETPAYTIAASGCTDPNACNYDADATQDDGSCLDCTTIDVDNIVAQPCDDGDPCTVNDLEAVLLCNGFVCVPCAGTFADADGDGVCDTDDVCPNFDDTKIGTACDDGDVCTTNDVYTSNCECVGTDSGNCLPDLELYLGDNVSCQTAIDVFGVAFHFFDIVNNGLAPSSASEIGLYLSTDATYDNQDVLLTTLAIPPLAPGEQFNVDMSADLAAAAPGPGTYYNFTIIDHLDTVSESDESNNFACDAGAYTIATPDCTDPVNDTDGDGVCDGDDICEGGDDNLDNDSDGIPDYCDDSTCVTIDEIGDTCDDKNDCTDNDVFVSYCVCLGTPINDADDDSICDEDDPCPNDFSNTCDLAYCVAEGTDTNYEFIQSFSMNSAVNNSGNDGGYGDYTGTSFGSVGNWNSTFEMTPGFSGTAYAEEWAIWIDYNKDGDFDDANEEIFRGTTNGTETLSTTLYLENGPGYYTRMRVAMRWNASPEPCGTYSYGEVEDYTVFFTNVSDKLTVENGTIQVYPNPADSYVNVDLHDIMSNGNIQSVQTMIYTMDGKQVYAEELDATSILTINTHHLLEGSYIIRLRADDGGTFTGRFVKL